MQKELASVAESVADRLHASDESRNLLVEQTREFKKNSSEVKYVWIKSVFSDLIMFFKIGTFCLF